MKNNLFTNGLIVFIGLMMLLAALQIFGWGQGVDSLEPEAFDISQLNQLDVDSIAAVSEVDDNLITKITTAPLFNTDRLPYVAEDLAEGFDTENEPTVVEPLKARVTSVMIVDDTSYAMVVDEVSNEKVTLAQGMPMPGEQGLWVVESIEPRMVTFSSEGNEPVSLELEVFDGKLNGKSNLAKKPATRANNRSNRNEANKPQEITQKNSAEEIRKKIAERRAQMRANAAKGTKQ